MNAFFRRCGDFCVTMFGIICLTFLFMYWLPGDPAELYAGEEASAADLAAVRQRLGVDRPLPIQFLNYVSELLKGDLGTSLRSGNPVVKEVASRLPVTLKLAGLATAIALIIAIPMGVVGVSRPGNLWSRLLEWGGLVVLATPVYWLGLLLILAVAVSLRLLPPGGSESWTHLILPSFALGAHTGAATARILKSSLVDVLARPYITTAYAKGAPPWRGLILHALPNASLPVITFLGMETGRLVGGTVLTETVFSINGLGRYLVASISFRDFPAVLGVVMVMALGVTAANLIADGLCALVDPKQR